MRYLFYLLLVVFFLSCQKEGSLNNEIDFSNVYAITDDPNDPVQHERYLIFKEFDVSVYFNDTIAQKFVRDDVYGNPVYTYETIDPNWVFYNDNDLQVDGTFRYFYVEDEEKRLTCLAYIRAFLEELVQEMRPTLIMLADSVHVVNSSGNITLSLGGSSSTTSFRTNFRGILITTLAASDEGEVENLFLSIKKDLISSKIYNYTDEIDEFENVVKDNYNRSGVFVFPTSDPYGNQTYGNYYGNPLCMFEIDGYSSYMEYLTDYPPSGVVDIETYIKDSRLAYTEIVGPWGFVAPRTVSTSLGKDATPSTVEQDIDSYLELMLKLSQEEFMEYWGKYSYVMKKYTILYEIIRDKMGIELYN